MATQNLRRRRASTLRVISPTANHLADADAVRKVLLDAGVPRDRVRVLVPAFAETAQVNAKEFRALERAGILREAPRVTAPKVVDWGTPKLPSGAAKRLYDRLVTRVVDLAADRAEDPFEAAERGYQRYQREFDQPVPALGLEPKDVIDAIVNGLV